MRERPALGIGEETEAPVDRRAERALALGSVAHAAGQRCKCPIKPRRELGRSEQSHSRSGQLECERQPVQPATDRGHVVCVRLVQDELGVAGSRAIEEHRDGAMALERRRRGGSRGVGYRERVHGIEPLGGQACRFATGDQDRQVRARSKQLGDERRARREVLEVVQHQQQMAVAEETPECAHGWLGVPDRRLHRPPDRGGEIPRLSHRRQLHESRPIREVLGQAPGRLDRQARLADAARPDQRDEAGSELSDQSSQSVQIGFASEQSGRRGGRRARFAHG